MQHQSGECQRFIMCSAIANRSRRSRFGVETVVGKRVAIVFVNARKLISLRFVWFNDFVDLKIEKHNKLSFQDKVGPGFRKAENWKLDCWIYAESVLRTLLISSPARFDSTPTFSLPSQETSVLIFRFVEKVLFWISHLKRGKCFSRYPI